MLNTLQNLANKLRNCYLVKTFKIITYSRWALKDDAIFLGKEFFYLY
jgi:hypothetical protein